MFVFYLIFSLIVIVGIAGIFYAFTIHSGYGKKTTIAGIILVLAFAFVVIYIFFGPQWTKNKIVNQLFADNKILIRYNEITGEKYYVLTDSTLNKTNDWLIEKFKENKDKFIKDFKR